MFYNSLPWSFKIFNDALLITLNSSLTLEHKPSVNLYHLKPWVKITRYLEN